MKSDCFNHWTTTPAFSQFIHKQCRKDAHYIGRIAVIRPPQGVSVIAHSPDVKQSNEEPQKSSKPIGIQIKKLKTRKKKAFKGFTIESRPEDSSSDEDSAAKDFSDGEDEIMD